MIDVVVTGRSWPALLSALDMAEVGLRVVVTAGVEEPRDVALRPDIRDPGGSVTSFMRRVAQEIDTKQIDETSAAAPVTRTQTPALLRGRNVAWAEQAQPNLLGIPAVPLASQSIALLGGAGALRAYLDRITPLLTVGKTRWFGDLVRKRLGGKVLRRLVDPHVYERYGVPAQEVEVAVAAPGLNETLSRAGALTSAVLAYADRNVARETRVRAKGGNPGLTGALLHKLELYGVDVRTEQVVAASAGADDGWSLALDTGEALQSRAIVIDFGSAPDAPAWLSGADLALGAAHARLYASTVMQAHALSREASGARSQRESADGAETVSILTREGSWSVRVLTGEETDEGDGAGLSRAYLSGSRIAVEALDESDLQRVVKAPEVELVDVLRSAGHEPVHGAEWSVGIEAAPFVSLAERHDAEAALRRAIETRPTLSPVGRSLHGGDEGSALDHAHKQAVELRRHLLGLDADVDDQPN